MEMYKILRQCPGGWLWKSGHPQVFFPHLFFYLFLFKILLSTCLYCGLECWKVSRKERGSDLWSTWRAMKYLESLEVLTHFEDRMFCLQEQYLIFSHLPTSCFCICISADPKRKDLFFLARNKQRFLFGGFLYCLIYLMSNDFTSFTWWRAAETRGIQWDAQYRNDSRAHFLCGWIECICSNHKVFRQLLYSGYAGRYLYLSACPSFLVRLIYFWLMSWYPLPGNDATFGRQTRNSMEGNKNILIALGGLVHCLFVFICREKRWLASLNSLTSWVWAYMSDCHLISTLYPAAQGLVFIQKRIGPCTQTHWFSQMVLCMPWLLDFCQIQA